MIPPTALGTVIAAIFGATYSIATYELHLWRLLWRVEIMGASVLLLVTSLVSWTLLEMQDSVQRALEKGPRYEWWLRVAAQTLLSGSLVALGIDFHVFLLMFLGFYVLSVGWAVSVSKVAGVDAIARTILPELINLALCAVFVVLTYLLYDRAVEFERTYASFVSDIYSFQLRQAYMRDKIVDIPPILFLCIGLMLGNLAWMVSRTGWWPNLLQRKV